MTVELKLRPDGDYTDALRGTSILLLIFFVLLNKLFFRFCFLTDLARSELNAGFSLSFEERCDFFVKLLAKATFRALMGRTQRPQPVRFVFRSPSQHFSD